MQLDHRKDRATQLAILLVLLIVLALVAAIAVVSITYHHLVLDGHWAFSSEWLNRADIPSRAAALGQLGDYFGGTLNPLLSFSGFLVLLLTVLLQLRQLLEGSRQLEQSTRAIDLEAFVRVNDILQTAEGIAARRRVYELTEEGPHHKPFDQWTPDDKQAAEVVCRQFELVGLLVQGRLFDPGLFLQSWQGTVRRCWSACQGVVAARRLRPGDEGLWRHFEALQGAAAGATFAKGPKP